MKRILMVLLLLISFLALGSCELSDIFNGGSQSGTTPSGQTDDGNGNSNPSSGDNSGSSDGSGTSQGGSSDSGSGSSGSQDSSGNQGGSTDSGSQDGSGSQGGSQGSGSKDDISTEGYYEDLFNIENKVEIAIEISNNELQKINAEPQKDVYRVADKVTVKITFKNGNTVEKSINEVGIKMKGNTSRDYFFEAGNIYNLVHYKLSFEETFDDTNEYSSEERKIWTSESAKKERKDRTFFGLSKLELKWNSSDDKTYSRDIYAAKAYQSVGVYAQNTTVGLLKFTNQTYQNQRRELDVYKVYEPVDKKFIKRNFGKSNKDGDLYKGSWGNNVGMPNLNNASSSSYGVDDAIYHDQKLYSYALKTNKTKSNHLNMFNFLHWINDNNDLNSTASQYLNVDYFVTFLAMQYLTGDWDNFMYDSNNYYIYFDKDNICYFIPYDMDRTFGVEAKFHDMANRRPTDNWNLQGDGNRSNLLWKTISVENSSLRSAYLNKINQIKNQVLDTNKFYEIYNNVERNYKSFLGDNLVREDGGNDITNAVPSYCTKKLQACS